jgi:hypothetical protein
LTTKQGSQLAYQVVTTEKQRFVPLSPHRASKAGRGVTDRNLRGFSEEGVHTRSFGRKQQKNEVRRLVVLDSNHQQKHGSGSESVLSGLVTLDENEVRFGSCERHHNKTRFALSA